MPGAAQNPDSVFLASKGFYQRRAYAVLHYDHRQVKPHRATVLSRLVDSGDAIGARRTSAGLIELRFGANGADRVQPCIADVYVNGARLERRMDARALSLDHLVRLSEVSGVEVFDRAHSPVGGEESCGVILVWHERAARRDDPEFTGVLRGRALDAGGQPVPGITVQLEPGGGRRTTDSAGRFDFGSIAPAHYVLTATGPEGGSWTMDVQVPAFGATDVVLSTGAALARGGQQAQIGS